MENSEEPWNTHASRRSRKKAHTRRERGESNHPANNPDKINSHIFDSARRLEIIKSKMTKIKKSPDFAPVADCFDKIYQTANQFCHDWRKPSKSTEICEIHLLGFGIGDFFDNPNAIPQLTFFTRLQQQLCGQLNEMAKKCENPQIPRKFRHFRPPEVYDPVYSPADKNILTALGFRARSDHRCFSPAQFARDLTEWPITEENDRIYLIFIPHTPVELPAVLLVDLVDTLRGYPTSLTERIAVAFIGNPIFPLDLKGSLPLVHGVDVGCEYDPAFGAFVDMKFTPVVFATEGQSAGRGTQAIVVDGDVEGVLRKIAQRGRQKPRSELK